MKPFLVIQLRPEEATADSEFAKILHYGQLTQDAVVRLRAEQKGLPEIHLDQYAGVIVGGSPFDISTPADQKTAIQREIEAGFQALFDDIVAMDFPFLGCCSGSGLLGHYLGASISRKYAEPVSSVEIVLTEEGKNDPLLKAMPESFKVLTGHKEACDSLPGSAVLLASNAQCPVQMFRVGKNVYATQFHPEGDPEGFAVRIQVYRNHGYFPEETAAQLIDAVTREYTPQAHAILARFVECYGKQDNSQHVNSQHANSKDNG